MRRFKQLAVGIWVVCLPHCLFGGESLPPQGTANGQWTSYGGDAGSTRYAPLDKINKDNFNRLQVVWVWDSPDQLISKTESGGEWRADPGTISAALAAETPNLYRRAGEPRVGSLKATPLMAE